MYFPSYCSFNFAHYKPNSRIHRYTQGVGKIAILTPVGVLPFSASLFYPKPQGVLRKWCVSTDRDINFKSVLYHILVCPDIDCMHVRTCAHAHIMFWCCARRQWLITDTSRQVEFTACIRELEMVFMWK